MKKGYSKIKIDEGTGMLHATRGIQLFNNHVDIDVKVEKVDDQITRINITASSLKLSQGSRELEEIEDRFLDTIYKFF